MGDVIDLTARLPATEPTAAPEPAAAPRADPLGVTRALVPRVARRLGAEVWRIPRRLWRLARYFGRGVVGHRDESGAWVGGWLGVVTWCLASRERDDARAIAKEKPGSQIMATMRADHIAVKHSGLIVIPHVVGGLLAHYRLGAWWLVLAPLIVATTVYGWRVDPRPPEPLGAPHVPGDITRDAIDDALRAVGILAKPTAARPNPEGVRLVRMPRRVGAGQEIVFDLPPSVRFSAADVIRERDHIAASLAVPLHQLVLESGEHPGRVVLWHSRTDPFGGTAVDHPLLDTGRWSVFDPIPLGTDARGRTVSAPIVGTHWLVGGVPNSGKTSASRGLSVGPVLDPDTDLYVFDGKQGKDWAAVAGIAERYESGPIPEQAARLHALLTDLVTEGDRRFRTLRGLPDEVCPDSELTRRISAEYRIPFVWLVIDEAHRHLADPRHGEAITELLIEYVRGFRGCGLGLLICTQDAEAALSERFTSVRRVIGTRFGLRVMDWQASNMILGDSMNTAGWNAAEILPSQRGAGILRADLEADGSADVRARKLRTFYLDAAAWRAVCETGAALRAARPQPVVELETPDEHLTATELLERLRALAPEVLPEAVRDAQAVGEYLSSRGVRVERRTAGQRLRSRASVEASLGLPRGALRVSRVEPGDTPVTADDGTGDTHLVTVPDTSVEV